MSSPSKNPKAPVGIPDLQDVRPSVRDKALMMVDGDEDRIEVVSDHEVILH